MEPALVLSEEKAAEHGYSGSGPFTFGGAFPGIYIVGQPLAISELGFETEDDAREAFDEAFEDAAPLEWTSVEQGEGRALRENHALSELEAIEQEALEPAKDPEGKKITTHAQADAAAEELGLTFSADPRPTVAEKVEAIEQARLARAGAGSSAMTPAPGAEDSTPPPSDSTPEEPTAPEADEGAGG